MKDGAIEGMQTFDGELEKMLRAGTITRDTALAYASNANNLALMINDLNEPSPSQQADQPEPAPTPTQTQTPRDVPAIEGFEP